MLRGIDDVLTANGVSTNDVHVDQLGGPANTDFYQAPPVSVLTAGLSWNPLHWKADRKRLLDVNMPAYLGAEQVGEAELYAYITNTYQDCLPTGHEPMLVLAGYSQGALLIHDVLNQLAANDQAGPAAMIKGAVLIGDPERMSFSDVINLGTATARDYGLCYEAETQPGVDSSCLKGGAPDADIAHSFASVTTAVCDTDDVVCDTSNDLNQSVIPDIINTRHGKWVHGECHSYCGSQVVTAGKGVGLSLIQDDLGASPSPSPSPSPTGSDGGAWESVEAPMPQGGNPGGGVPAIACPSATGCVVASSYYDGDTSQGLLLSGGGTTWAATTSPLPTNAAPEAEALLDAVACPDAAHCTAVGRYDPANGTGYEGLLVTGSGSSWTPAEAPLPANASAANALTGVACASASACVAIGSYVGTTGDIDPMLLSGSGGAWKSYVPGLPANASAEPDPQLDSVACPASGGDCVAIGTYIDAAGQTEGLVLTGSSSAWTAVQAPLPVGATGVSTLTSVACPAASQCVAVGNLSSAGDYAGLILTESPTGWTAHQAPIPANGASVDGAPLDAVACSSASACTVIGTYAVVPNEDVQGMIVTGAGSTWSATLAPLPTGSATDDDSGLDAVACPSGSTCVAVGSYSNAAGTVNDGLIETASGNSWTPDEVPLPDNSQTDHTAYLYAVACSSASSCTAGGAYSDIPDGSAVLLATGPS